MPLLKNVYYTTTNCLKPIKQSYDKSSTYVYPISRGTVGFDKDDSTKKLRKEIPTSIKTKITLSIINQTDTEEDNPKHEKYNSEKHETSICSVKFNLKGFVFSQDTVFSW